MRFKERVKVVLMAYAVAALVAMALPVSAQQVPNTIKNFQVPFTSAARTSSSNSATFDVGQADNLVLYLSVTAQSGTTPTLDVKCQDSPDGGTTFFDIAGTAFTQVGATTSSQVVTATRKFGSKIRVVTTIAGTTPSYTFAVFFLSYKT